MLETIRRIIKDKKVAVLGYGREGKSTYPWLEKAGCAREIVIADLNPVKNPPEGVRLVEGPDYLNIMDWADVVFKSPGIVLDRKPEDIKCQICSQISVFFERYRDQIIGITGTKGKSTVSTLLYHVLKESGEKTLLAGNIGIPVFDVVKDIEDDTRIVVELSCHQLEYEKLSPHMGTVLNIHEEHLDHYGTMDRYVHAKENIYRHMQENDVLLCNVENCPADLKANVITFGAEGLCGDSSANVWVKDGKISFNFQDLPYVNVIRERFEQDYCIPVNEISLLGVHNYYDIAYVYTISKILNITTDNITNALKTYVPLAHRLEYTGTVNGVRYYDDSISTIDETAIMAMESVPDVDTVIIGGMDRGISYEALEKYLSESSVENIILMEATGERIFREIHDRVYVSDFNKMERLYLRSHLEDAVKTAKEVTKPGKACVMSPAAASYGIFKNFEERGAAFKELVLKDN